MINNDLTEIGMHNTAASRDIRGVLKEIEDIMNEALYDIEAHKEKLLGLIGQCTKEAENAGDEYKKKALVMITDLFRDIHFGKITFQQIEMLRVCLLKTIQGRIINEDLYSTVCKELRDAGLL